MNAKNKGYISHKFPMIVEVPHAAKSSIAYRRDNSDDLEALYSYLEHNTAFWFEFETLDDVIRYLRQTKREHRITGANQHVYYARKAIAKLLRYTMGR